MGNSATPFGGSAMVARFGAQDRSSVSYGPLPTRTPGQRQDVNVAIDGVGSINIARYEDSPLVLATVKGPSPTFKASEIELVFVATHRDGPTENFALLCNAFSNYGEQNVRSIDPVELLGPILNKRSSFPYSLVGARLRNVDLIAKQVPLNLSGITFSTIEGSRLEGVGKPGAPSLLLSGVTALRITNSHFNRVTLQGAPLVNVDASDKRSAVSFTNTICSSAKFTSTTHGAANVYFSGANLSAADMQGMQYPAPMGGEFIKLFRKSHIDRSTRFADGTFKPGINFAHTIGKTTHSSATYHASSAALALQLLEGPAFRSCDGAYVLPFYGSIKQKKESRVLKELILSTFGSETPRSVAITESTEPHLVVLAALETLKTGDVGKWMDAEVSGLKRRSPVLAIPGR